MSENYSRREFLAVTTAVTLAAPRMAMSEPATTLTAGVTEQQLLPEDYGPTTLWTYNNSAPGPELRVRQGDRLVRRFVNGLPQPSSVHWHGIRIVNAMDGVSGLTQTAVEPGAVFDYEFRLPDAGTYWYHAHNRSFEQVARGLYGPLIVDEITPPDVDRDLVLVLDDWRVNPETEQLWEPFDAPHDNSHAGRLGNYVTTNGIYNFAHDVRQGERLRLRVINASNARIFKLGTEGLKAWVVALDGMPLVSPRLLEGTIPVAPAQRADLIVDVLELPGSAAHLVHVEQGESFSQAAFEVTGQGPALRTDAPAPLPPNPYIAPEMAGATRLELRMEGGAMGGMAEAMQGGAMQSMRTLAGEGMFWALNGQVDGMMRPPLADLRRGENVRLSLVNDTAFPHGMHLHGMHFHEILPDGNLGDFRDTTLVNPGTRRDILFRADNPGDWMLHCHMLGHAASGMMTWVRVV